MATYTVIQDIEAEDKLVGPLTLRQFIYAAIAALCLYLSFICLTKGAAFLLVIFMPVALFTGFFAAPWGRDQPTEVWALAKIRFFIKPRRRIWDQSGVRDLVNITAPKLVENAYTNGLTQTEVQSRLKALADTIDSRGWVIKNVNANLYDPTRLPSVADSDRLITPGSMPKEVSRFDVLASDDMLDELNNPVAQNLDRLVQTSSKTHRDQLIDQLRQQASPTKPTTDPILSTTADYWFLNQPLNLPQTAVSAPQQAAVVAPGSDAQTTMSMSPGQASDEKALAEKLRVKRQNLQTVNYQHMKVIQPINTQTAQRNEPTSQPAKLVPVTPQPDPAKMLLATRNDLNVATIGRIVNKQDEQPDEVVISLHDHAS
jgi:hypothetical protein